MTHWLPDAQMWFKNSLPEQKTVAALTNSWKSDRLLSVKSHAGQILKGKFMDSTIEKKCPLEKEYTAQSKFIVSFAYRANSEFKRACVGKPGLGREELSLPDRTG